MPWLHVRSHGQNGWRPINPVRKGFVGKMVREAKTAAKAEHRRLPDYTNISSKKLVAIDQHMSDLLYRGSGVDKTIYRYTHTRRKDMYA
jgi:hypothetical protein